jgi:capsular polysaccharide biosynthesis protein
MFDILPKLIILEKIIDVKEIDYFYSPEIKKWQLDTLSIFDINKDRLINSNKYRHIEANEIIGSSHPWYSKGYILEEVNKIPDWIFHEINNRYLKFKQNFSCNSNFYIDRRETTNTHCQIINDDEVKDYLIKKGFSIYKVGTLNFFEQIYLFNNAKIIIGAHGAAFANLVFCNKDTKVIDIIPENHPNLVDASIGKYKQLNFNYIKTKKLHDKNLNGDIWLDINDLNKLI